MKLAVSTLGCPDWNLRRIAAFLHDYSVCGLEIRGICGVMQAWEIPCLKHDAWSESRSILEDAGAEIICLGTSCRFHEEDSVQANLDEGMRTIEVANRIGAGAIRVFGDALPSEPGEKEAVLDRVFRSFQGLCDFARGSGVTVCHETHGDFNTLDVLSREVQSLGNTPQFGIIWDVMHTYRSGGRDFLPYYEIIKPLIHHLHVKDYTRDKKIVPCGRGDIPLPEILAQLQHDGYDGYLSFEWEKVWHPDLAGPEEVFPAFADYFKSIGA